MRVAVWGAGEIGTATAYRLAASPHISEIHWINRSEDRIRQRVVDLQHGLAFAPACHWVKAYAQQRARRALMEADLVVLTLGGPVPQGGSRQDLLHANRSIIRSAVVPALKLFDGIVLVVSNPVEPLAQLIHEEATIEDGRCLGLGTVVETARLRAALAKHARPLRSPRDVFAYAIGTHDQHFVPVTLGASAIGAAPWRDEVIEAARLETIHAAARVKVDGRSTLHPVVEGVVSVVEAIASDRHSIHTVSSWDPDERLFFSLPCTLGREGVVCRHLELLSDQNVREKLDQCLAKLRKLVADPV